MTFTTARVEVRQWLTEDGEMRWDIDWEEGQNLTTTVGMLALAQQELYRRSIESEDE